MLLVVRVEAVVTDLDGTVVRSDFSVSPATLTPWISSGTQGSRSSSPRHEPRRGWSTLMCWHLEPPGRLLLGRDRVVFPRAGTRLGGLDGPASIGRVVEIAVNEGAGVASFDGSLWRMTDEYFRLSPTQPHGPPRVVVESAELAETRAAPWPCDTRTATSIASPGW